MTDHQTTDERPRRRLLRRAALAFAASFVGVFVAFGIHLWRIHQPSAETRGLENVYAARPSLPDERNAYIDMYGLGAPKDADPRKVGLERIAWSRHLAAGSDLAVVESDTTSSRVDDARSALFERIVAACRRDGDRACADSIARVNSRTELTSLESVLVPRYEAMTKRGGWYESVMMTVTGPMPDFAHAIEAQRLELLRLIDVAKQGDSARVRETLERDMSFWRAVHRFADTLISKMIAIAAIRQNFVYGSQVLRMLPVDRVAAAIPEAWRREFTRDELSMLRVMAGEIVFLEGEVRRQARESESEGPATDHGEDFDDDEPDLVDRVLAHVPALLGPEVTVNRLSHVYTTLAEDFAVPLDRYLEVASGFHAKFGRGSNSFSVERYALRTGALEAVRRLALNVADSRARAVPDEGVETALHSMPPNPFDGQPYKWNAAAQAVVFVVAGKNERWNRLVLLY